MVAFWRLNIDHNHHIELPIRTRAMGEPYELNLFFISASIFANYFGKYLFFGNPDLRLVTVATPKSLYTLWSIL